MLTHFQCGIVPDCFKKIKIIFKSKSSVYLRTVLKIFRNIVMDDKKIYEFLQDWFPELKQKKIPKKKTAVIIVSFLIGWGRLQKARLIAGICKV